MLQNQEGLAAYKRPGADNVEDAKGGSHRREVCVLLFVVCIIICCCCVHDLSAMEILILLLIKILYVGQTDYEIIMDNYVCPTSDKFL